MVKWFEWVRMVQERTCLLLEEGVSRQEEHQSHTHDEGMETFPEWVRP